MIGMMALLLAAGAPAEATRAFQKCVSCHGLTETGLPGPPLGGAIGRRAGTVAGFDYSEAMLAAGRAGLVWDEATLERFLDAPEAVVPGTAMARPPRTTGAERVLIFGLIESPPDGGM